MIKQEFGRIDGKRKATLGAHRQKQFATPMYQNLEYKHRLNFYVTPPTADITLEQFEQWAIDRLRGVFPSPLALLPFESSSSSWHSRICKQEAGADRICVH